MKRIALLTIICFMLLLNNAYAHPPSKIDINYDKATNTISSVIKHKSFFKKKHRISNVEILINGELVKTEVFDIQFNRKEQRFSSVLENIKDGDEISIVAYCNLYGKRTASMQVEY